MPTIPIVEIQFPEIKLATRDAHKLRGWFGSFFKDESPLLHNHFEDGSLRVGYPLVQYKILNNIPTLIGLSEGATLLSRLFTKVQQLTIQERVYPVLSKDIRMIQSPVGYADQLICYQFETLWMAINQKNHSPYLQLAHWEDRKEMLQRLLIGNVLSFFKSQGIFLESSQRLMAHIEVKEKSSQFKNQKMLAFSGEFMINAALPNRIGLGKSVSRGFGTIAKK